MALDKTKRGIPFIIIGCCILPLGITMKDGTPKMIILGLSILLNMVGLVISIINIKQTTKK